MKRRLTKYGLPFIKFILYVMICSLSGLSPIISNGQINAYAKVTSISGPLLSLSNVNQTYHHFQQGEQIIVMQMQDSVIGADTLNNASFGALSNIANAGNYEIAIILNINSVAGIPVSVQLAAPLQHNYNTSFNAAVQIISFNLLSNTNYTISSPLAALPWNGNIGGVLALQVGGTLTLSASLTADGQGFRGGGVSDNTYSVCGPSIYDTISMDYGYKGEGIFSSPTINFLTRSSRGPLLNGGGGGGQINAGGGGGGNYSAGGLGGPGWSCQNSPSGGIGGNALNGNITGSRIFMGGGGGGGQQNDFVGGIGGTGGGIILVKAGSIATNCTSSTGLSISASGNPGANSGPDGAGGGGAGGTVIVQTGSFSVPSSCPLLIRADGGNGGIVTSVPTHGGGGGGGQGVVIYSTGVPPATVTTTTQFGLGGLNSQLPNETSAGNGVGPSNTGILFGAGQVLPIGFVSFTAAASGNKSLLNWRVNGTDQQVSFTIQRSADGNSFLNIGTLNASLQSGNADYSFTDNQPLNGKSFYRIMETDISGAVTYSTIRTVDLNETESSFSIFPNPSDGQFTIRLQEPTAQLISLSIYDLAGKTVYSSICQPTGNFIPVSLNRSLAKGLYILRLNGNTFNQSGKLIIK